MSQVIKGMLNGVFQNETGYYARIKTDFVTENELNIPITIEEFHQLPVAKPVKIIVEIMA